MPFYFYKILYFIFILLFLYYYLNKEYDKMLLLIVISIPFKSVYLIFGGVYLEVWKTASLLLLPKSVLLLSKKQLSNYYSKVIIYIVYASIVTLTFGFSVGITNDSGEIFKTALRPISQILMLFAFCNIIFIFSLYARNINSLQVIKYFILGVIISSILGLLQYYILEFSGFNIFPIPRMTGILQEDVSFHYGNKLINRINAISMEPKNLAFNLAWGLIFMLEKYILTGTGFFKKYNSIYFLIVLLALYLTYSTLGYTIFGLYIVYILICIKIKKNIFIRLIKLFSVIFLVVGVLSITSGSLFSILEQRTYKRVVQKDAVVLEHFDQACLNFLKANKTFIITGVGLGNIHNYAYDYLPKDADYAKGSSWNANSGFFYLLTNVGIIGFVLFLLLNVISFDHFVNTDTVYFKRIIIFSLCVLLLRYNEIHYFILGFYFINKNIPKEQSNLL